MQTQEPMQTNRQTVNLVRGLEFLPESQQTITLLSLWQWSSWMYADHVALRSPHSNPLLEMTYAEVYRLILDFAGGLQNLGMKPGDRIALIAPNSPRWLIAEQSSLLAGLVTVPLSPTADGSELAAILQHSGSRTVIVPDTATWQRLRPHIAYLRIPRVILLSDDTENGCLSFPKLVRQGRGRYIQPPLTRTHLATLSYSTSTPGSPEGVMLTHGNLMHQLENLEGVIQPRSGKRALSVLPPWHCYERVWEYYLLALGCTVIYTDRHHLYRDLQVEAPDYLIAVPQVWEQLYDRIQQRLNRRPYLVRQLLRMAFRFSQSHLRQQRLLSRQGMEPWQSIQCAAQPRWRQRVDALVHQLTDRLLYRRLRQSIAPRLAFAPTWGNPLPPTLELFYEMLGIPILNGYGSAETTGLAATRRGICNTWGTVGTALPHTEIRVVHPETRSPLPPGDAGLVLVRGPQVMSGYYNNPTATAAVLSGDRWLNTGDEGYLTPNGQLVITKPAIADARL